MVFGLGYLIGRLFFTAVAVGMGNNRNCGMLVPFLLSVLISPLATIPFMMFTSGYKHNPDDSVFLRDKNGKLVPALDNKGEQRYDRDTNQPLYLKQVKDGQYYKDRERRFLKTLFITLPFAPVLAVPKLLVWSGRRIISAGGRVAQNFQESHPQTAGRIRKIPEEVYRRYEEMCEESERVVDVSEAESQGESLVKEPEAERVAVDSPVEECDKEVSTYRGYELPDGELCIVCRKNEMENLRVRLMGTDYDGCRLVTEMEMKDLYKESVVAGVKRGLVRSSEQVPHEFGLVYSQGRFVDALEYNHIDRKPFDGLLWEADRIIGEFSSHSVVFENGTEMHGDLLYSIRTGRNSIEFMHSGDVVGSISFDPQTGAVRTECDILNYNRQLISQYYGVDVRPPEGCSPSDVLSDFGRIVLSGRNLEVLSQQEGKSLEMVRGEEVGMNLRKSSLSL